MPTPGGKTVFFLHIPKCAGTTLTEEVIKKRFQPQELIIFYDQGTKELIKMLQEMPLERQKEIKCIAGHYVFGIHRFYHARPPAYITLLRDPIERVISHYCYVLRQKSHYLNKKMIKDHLSLKEYIKNQLSVELDNGQTRLLAGLGHSADFGKCSRAMLDKAKANLAEFFPVVGISERFEDFLKLVNRKLGWEIPAYENRNIGKNKLQVEELDTETLEIIKENNRLDLELYQYVQSHFTSELDDI